MMGGVELFRDPHATDGPVAFDYAERIGHRVCMAGRAHGLMLRPLGDVIILVPPLSITPDEIDFLVAGLAASIADVLG